MSEEKIEVSIKDIPEIIEQLKQAEKEIEFERKSKNLFIDDLYKVCEMSLKQDKEIERLNNKIQDLQADYGNKAQVERDLLKEENHRLNNIIKEVREYIKNNYYKDIAKGDGTLRETILEILDKENKC